MQSTISTMSGMVESVSTFMINGIYKNPPFSISNKIPILGHKYVKLAAVVAIHLGLLFQILRMFKPRNTKEMYSIYVVCFWILLITISILVVNPYDEESIEYMLSKEDIEKLKRMSNENVINNPVVPEPEGLLFEESDNLSQTSSKKSSSTPTQLSSMNIVGIVFMVVFFGGLKIYSFLATPV
jgi:uncharacterized protein with PQ loop repeat